MWDASLWHVRFSLAGARGPSSADSVAAALGLSCPALGGILVPQAGISPTSSALGGRFLTTGLPEGSCVNFRIALPDSRKHSVAFLEKLDSPLSVQVNVRDAESLFF